LQEHIPTFAITGQWEQIKDTINEVAESVLGKKRKRKKMAFTKHLMTEEH